MTGKITGFTKQARDMAKKEEAANEAEMNRIRKQIAKVVNSYEESHKVEVEVDKIKFDVQGEEKDLKQILNDLKKINYFCNYSRNLFKQFKQSMAAMLVEFCSSLLDSCTLLALLIWCLGYCLILILP